MSNLTLEMAVRQTIEFQSVTPRLAGMRSGNATIAALRVLVRTLIRELLRAHFSIVWKVSTRATKVAEPVTGLP